MELIVSEIKEIEEIKFNYEELKKELQIKVDNYKSIAYTKETIKDAKDDRAKLNKLKKAISDQRISMKKRYLEPFENFEKQTKELEKMIEDGSTSIDTQVKSFEQTEKSEKLKQIGDFFEGNVEELIEVLNFDKIYNEKWLNATYKMSDIEEEIKHLIIKSRQDLIIIRNLNSEFETNLIDFYFKKLNLSETMQEKIRLEEQKKKLDVLKEQENLKTSMQKKTESTQNIQNSVLHTIKSIENSTVQQIDFRVWVTQEQKFNLREFIVKNNIKYGSVK